MRFDELLKTPSERLVCIGGGLVALDVVVVDRDSGPPRLWAGGSCGNVMAILAYLGWTCFPVTRLKKDLAAQKIVEDLSRWRVRTDFILQLPTGSTPIIVERISTNRHGVLKHRFEWFCPSCGSRLPSYRPVPSRLIEEVIPKLLGCNVVYFDRANRFNLEIARSRKNMGSLVFFEPQRFEDSTLFRECVDVADVIKYSFDRIPGGFSAPSAKMEVQTMGAAGLRLRAPCTGGAWISLPSEPVRQFKDAAGAGDWCTAGIIHYLTQGSVKLHGETDLDEFVEACRFGQVLATFNCSFEGARGGMYSISDQEFRSEISAMWDRSHLSEVRYLAPQGSWDLLRMVCPGCIDIS